MVHEAYEGPAHDLSGQESGYRRIEDRVAGYELHDVCRSVTQEESENVRDDDDDGREFHALPVPEAEDDGEDYGQSGQHQFVFDVAEAAQSGRSEVKQCESVDYAGCTDLFHVRFRIIAS